MMNLLYQQKAAELKEYAKKTANLSTVISTEKYPVCISFFSQGEQVSLFDYLNNKDSEEEQTEGKTPGLQFVFRDKIEIKTQDDFCMAEEVFNKLKALAKEVNRLYLNAFCEQVKAVCAEFNVDETLGVHPVGIHPIDVDWRTKKFFLAVVDKRDFEGIIDQINRRTALPKHIIDD